MATPGEDFVVCPAAASAQFQESFKSCVIRDILIALMQEFSRLSLQEIGANKHYIP